MLLGIYRNARENPPFGPSQDCTNFKILFSVNMATVRVGAIVAAFPDSHSFISQKVEAWDYSQSVTKQKMRSWEFSHSSAIQKIKSSMFNLVALKNRAESQGQAQSMLSTLTSMQF